MCKGSRRILADIVRIHVRLRIRVLSGVLLHAGGKLIIPGKRSPADDVPPEVPLDHEDSSFGDMRICHLLLLGPAVLVHQNFDALISIDAFKELGVYPVYPDKMLRHIHVHLVPPVLCHPNGCGLTSNTMVSLIILYHILHKKSIYWLSLMHSTNCNFI